MQKNNAQVASKLVGLVLLSASVFVAGCSRNGQPVQTPSAQEILNERWEKKTGLERNGSTLRSSLVGSGQAETLGRANRYIWTAALETLDFLPIENVDPFSGLIVTGFGTPPGGTTSYRATILVSDPALDARSLNLALSTARGTVDAATVQAVENAILTRARQLRTQDGAL